MSERQRFQTEIHAECATRIAELEAENKRLRDGVAAALRGVCDGRNELTELLWPDPSPEAPK